MSRLTIAFAAAALLALGSAAWKADAMTAGGAAHAAFPSKNVTLIQRADCRKHGGACGKGLRLLCGTFHCRCGPC
jgi:hypothetical protein